MNTLSWLIYLGNVIDNIGSTLSNTAAIVLFFMVPVVVIALVAYFTEISCTYRVNERVVKSVKLSLRISIPTIFLALFLGLFSQFVPTKETVYAIAASEMGEVVVNTPEAQEVLQALKDKILDQLSPEQTPRTVDNPFEE